MNIRAVIKIKEIRKIKLFFIAGLQASPPKHAGYSGMPLVTQAPAGTQQLQLQPGVLAQVREDIHYSVSVVVQKVIVLTPCLRKHSEHQILQ